MHIVDVRGVPPDLALWRRLAALNDPDTGRIAVSVRPGIRRGSWLGQDLLRCLGGRTDVTGAGRNMDEGWAWLPAWFRGYHVRELLVLHAEILLPRLLDPLLLLTASLDLDLWLLSERLSDEQALHRQTWTTDTLSWSDLTWPWPARSHPDPPEEPFPAVPDADFVRFRAVARDTLSAESFLRVDRLYSAELARGLAFARDGSITKRSCRDALAALVARCRTLPEMTTALRALQAALFRKGWLLHADLRQLLNRWDGVVAPDPVAWSALRAYRQPWRGAVCVLAGAGCSIEQMQALRMRDVVCDGSELSIEGERISIERAASVLLRAQRELRRTDGATDDDLFLVRSDRPLGDRPIVQLLAAAARETGVVLISRQVSRRIAPSRSWIASDGFSLQELRP